MRKRTDVWRVSLKLGRIERQKDRKTEKRKTERQKTERRLYQKDINFSLEGICEKKFKMYTFIFRFFHASL